MKTLYIMRHAKSDWSYDLPDIERPLNKRGNANAPRIGRELVLRKSVPQLILSSPAVRAQATAKYVATACSYEAEVVTKEDFYIGSHFDARDNVKELSNRIDSVLIVGHNPTWENLASYFVQSFRPAKFPTAAVAKINFDTEDWNSISSENSNLEWFIVPKELSE